ncbi:protease pro-enzyme activation domain-containing protein [Thiomonas sp.]
MTRRTYVELPGSHRLEPAAAIRIADVAPDEPVEVRVDLKPRPDDAKTSHCTRAELNALRATAHQSDIQCVTDFAQQAGLSVVSVEPGRRLIKLLGPAAKVEAAFQTKLGHDHDGKHRFRGRSGPVLLPNDVAAVVEAVLGLDTRPAAESRIVQLPDASAMPGYLPNQVGALYDFPTEASGAGQCIALIELGGGWLSGLGYAGRVPGHGPTPPRVVAVSIDHGANRPHPDNGADGEMALDHTSILKTVERRWNLCRR